MSAVVVRYCEFEQIYEFYVEETEDGKIETTGTIQIYSYQPETRGYFRDMTIDPQGTDEKLKKYVERKFLNIHYRVNNLEEFIMKAVINTPESDATDEERNDYSLWIQHHPNYKEIPFIKNILLEINDASDDILYKMNRSLQRKETRSIINVTPSNENQELEDQDLESDVPDLVSDDQILHNRRVGGKKSRKNRKMKNKRNNKSKKSKKH